MDEIIFQEPKVVNVEIPRDSGNPRYSATEVSVYSTKISHDKEGRSAKEIWQAEKGEYEENELRGENRNFLDKLGNLGHSSAFYQANVGINYEIPRSLTMFFCQFDFSKYLQQSLRYTPAKFFISSLADSEEVRELYTDQMDLYREMVDEGIRKEDGRYVLPLATAAKHLHENTNLVDLANHYRVLESENSKLPPFTEEILDGALEMLGGEEPNLFRKELIDIYNRNEKHWPVANIFSKENRWVNQALNQLDSDETVSEFHQPIDQELIEKSRGKFSDEALSFLNLSNLMGSTEEVEGYVSSMSLAAWHQFMRQDTTKQSVESVYDAASRGNIVVPPSIQGSGQERDYRDLCQRALETYEERGREEGEEKAVEVLPHGLELGIAFSVDGFNAMKGFLPDRTDEAAQWEIRRIAKEVKDGIY